MKPEAAREYYEQNLQPDYRKLAQEFIDEQRQQRDFFNERGQQSTSMQFNPELNLEQLKKFAKGEAELERSFLRTAIKDSLQRHLDALISNVRQILDEEKHQ